MASTRRIGAPDAKNREVLLDAAEQLMLEDGYAAVTSRRVAERAGLKPQLVHYYFRTMDDLFIEVFRRLSQLGLELHAEAMKSKQPLWAMWHFGSDPQFTRLTMEFMGLANHRKGLREEIALYADRFRKQQVEAMTAILSSYGYETADVPPVVRAVFATSVSRVLAVEHSLGVSFGHGEVIEFCEEWLRKLEGERATTDASASA